MIAWLRKQFARSAPRKYTIRKMNNGKFLAIYHGPVLDHHIDAKGEETAKHYAWHDTEESAGMAINAHSAANNGTVVWSC